MFDENMKRVPMDIFGVKIRKKNQCKELIKECFSKVKSLKEYYVFEDLIQHLLRIGYNCEVINLNTIDKNHPAVDLQYNTIMFQVTVDTENSKIKETIQKFFEHKLNERSSKLIIISRYNSPHETYKYFDTQVEILSVEELIDEIFKLSEIKITSTPANFANLLLEKLNEYLFILNNIESCRTQEFNPYI